MYVCSRFTSFMLRETHKWIPASFNLRSNSVGKLHMGRELLQAQNRHIGAIGPSSFQRIFSSFHLCCLHSHMHTFAYILASLSNFVDFPQMLLRPLESLRTLNARAASRNKGTLPTRTQAPLVCDRRRCIMERVWRPSVAPRHQHQSSDWQIQ